MQTHEVRTFAADLLLQIGESPGQIDFWTRGASCTVWKVQSDRKSYALRIVEDEERVLDGKLDAYVRSEVTVAGGRVVQPVLNSKETDLLIGGMHWSLDVFVHGLHPKRGSLPENVCHQIGETLSALHSLSTKEFGKPKMVVDGSLVGSKRLPLQGVQQRFENPIPETWKEGFVHPVLSLASDLKLEIYARLNGVSNVVGDGNGVLCHSDLHDKQIICANGGLAALIDLGDATILDRHWDFGSIYYFHGEKNAKSVVEAYQATRGIPDITMDTVASFSVAVAMHHGSRSRLPGKSHRLDQAINHIRKVVQ